MTVVFSSTKDTFEDSWTFFHQLTAKQMADDAQLTAAFAVWLQLELELAPMDCRSVTAQLSIDFWRGCVSRLPFSENAICIERANITFCFH